VKHLNSPLDPGDRRSYLLLNETGKSVHLILGRSIGGRI